MVGITRRDFAAAGFSVAALSAAGCASAGPTLGQAARGAGLDFGSAFDREVLADRAYGELLTAQCNKLVVENTLKFDWLRPKGPQADFSHADRIVNFGQQAGLPVRATALVWNDWTPPWLDRLSVREVEATFDRHIEETVGRYRGRIAMWDVVNEPFFPIQRRAGGFRQGVWFNALGPAYIARAFKRAAAADPGATLILNEAFCEQDDDWGTEIRPRLLALTKKLRDDGVKIDGIGFQAHLKPHLPHDYRRFAEYAQSFAALGLDIHLTELDVDDSSFPDEPAARDAKVAAQLESFLTPVLGVNRLKSITVWHLSDRFSWYLGHDGYKSQVRTAGGNPQRTPRTHLYDQDLRPKAAWHAVHKALSARA